VLALAPLAALVCNPAIVQVGTTYTDLGATITGTQQHLNLGIQTYVKASQ
jgi:hypothetical protein